MKASQGISFNRLVFQQIKAIVYRFGCRTGAQKCDGGSAGAAFREGSKRDIHRFGCPPRLEKGDSCGSAKTVPVSCADENEAVACRAPQA